MARGTPQALTATDLDRFIKEEADFAFEMSVLTALRMAGLEAEHAAVYADPVTGRLRSYDIRARWTDGMRSYRFAVECKNLRPSSPLLLHATPRLLSEAYHSVVARYRIGGVAFQDVHSRSGVYRPDEPVGRQTDQPSIDPHKGFKSVDSSSFDKWLQAVNGCAGLVKDLVEGPLPEPHLWVVVPMLVVPRGTLWQVSYDSAGQILQSAESVDHVAMILRHRWGATASFASVTYDISHLEIVTDTGLPQRIKNLVGTGGLLANTEGLVRDR